MDKSINRILVIRTDKIGDVVLSLPVVSALRNCYPESTIAMMVQPGVREIVEDYPGLNSVLYDTPEDHNLQGFIRLIRTFKQGSFDAALLLHPTLRLALAMVFAGIPIRIGTGYRFYSLLFNRRIIEHRKDSRRHEIEYNLSLAEAIGADVSEILFRIHVLPEAIDRVTEILNEMGVEPDRPLVVLHPGSKGSALEWPRRAFGELAERLTTELNAQVILTGGKGEQGVIDEVLRPVSEKVWTLVDSLTLKELVALLKKADLVIANSTGPLHLAAAVGTTVIGIYPPCAPMHARRWGPYGQLENVLIPVVPECRRCVKASCVYWNCMEAVSVGRVFQLAGEKLHKRVFNAVG